MPPLRLAIVECDSPSYPNFLATYGNLTRMFSILFDRALPLLPPSSAPTPLVLTRHHVVNPPESVANLPPAPCPESTFPDLDAVDAVLLSGSKHTAWSDEPWVLELVEWTRQAVDSGKVKMVGVCFGEQILARALGVEVRVAPGGREGAVDTVDLTDEGKRVFGLDTMRIQQMHRDDVAALPPGTTLLGSSPKCPVQAFYRPGRYIAVQGHPEITADFMTEILTERMKTGAYAPEFFADAIARAGLEHDGVLIAKAFLEFLVQ